MARWHFFAAVSAWTLAVACSGSSSSNDDAEGTETRDAGDAAAEDDARIGSDADAAPPDADTPSGPTLLSDPSVGLYSDIRAKTLADDVLAYEPRFVLWSDAAEKHRWVRLPVGQTIDTSDPDQWELPVGARLFKEFSKDGKRLETRMIERIAMTDDPRADYRFLAFVWNDDESEAVSTPEGAPNVRGTTHDVPPQEQCGSCHGGEKGRALGFTAIDLAHEGAGATLSSLGAAGRLSTVVTAPALGHDDALTALGVLHANCGHCHNPRGPAWRSTNVLLRLSAADDSAEAVLATLVGVSTNRFLEVPLRVDPGQPDTSAIAVRMATRGTLTQMPPLATEQVDSAGLAVVRDWIATLPK